MANESKPSNPYELALADLRARRAHLDVLIAGLEAMVAGGAVPSGVTAASSIVDSPAEGPGAFLGMSIHEAAKKLLASKRKPLRNPEIAAAFKAGGLVLNSAEPANTIGSVLTRRFVEVGDVVKVDRGTWGLKEWYPNRSFKKDKPDSPEPKAEAKAEAKTEPSPTAPRVRKRLSDPKPQAS